MELLLSVIIICYYCVHDFHIHIGLNGFDLSASFYHPLEGSYHQDNE